MICEDNYFIEITSDPLDLSGILHFVLHESCGAAEIFIGTVRNQSEGRPVTGIHYHGYPEMGEKILERIVRYLLERWQVRAVAVKHRIGMLHLTEASVIIAVSSPHRAEAFEACRYVIEEIKKELPVWKQQYFKNGINEWKKSSGRRNPVILFSSEKL